MTGGGGGGWPPPEGRDEGGWTGGASILGEHRGGGLVTGIHSSQKASAQFSIVSPCDDGDGGPRLGAVVQEEMVESMDGLGTGVSGGDFLNICGGSIPGNGMQGHVANPSGVHFSCKSTAHLSVASPCDDGDGGPRLGAVVQEEMVDTMAGMETAVNCGSFLNACGGSVLGTGVQEPVANPASDPRWRVSATGELLGSVAMRIDEVSASSAEGVLGSSTTWMAEDLLPGNSSDLEPPRMGTDVEMLSSPPGGFCMGNPHGVRFGGPSCATPRMGSQGVRRYAPAMPPSPGLAVHDQDGQYHGQVRSGIAWQRPSRVALPQVEELGVFSVDGATAILDPVEVEATSQRFEAALVGRMFGRRIPFGMLSGELRRRWASYGNIRIVTLSGDYFVCFFDNIIARDEALLGGPWVILGQVLGVDRWTPTFSLKSKAAFSTPVWVRMPTLPLYCWSSRNIARIAALIG